MEPCLTFAEALDALREGKAVARTGWQPDAYGCHRSLVLIPGREIKASFPPMVNFLGEGTEFFVEDHVDAIYRHECGHISTVVGYQFLQQDILTNDWLVV